MIFLESSSCISRIMIYIEEILSLTSTSINTRTSLERFAQQVLAKQGSRALSLSSSSGSEEGSPSCSECCRSSASCYTCLPIHMVRLRNNLDGNGCPQTKRWAGACLSM